MKERRTNEKDEEEGKKRILWKMGLGLIKPGQFLIDRFTLMTLFWAITY